MGRPRKTLREMAQAMYSKLLMQRGPLPPLEKPKVEM
jgi:hypothetical protein